jgi:hypothetical protein
MLFAYRFVSVDPKGFVDGPNPYEFVVNDPVNKRDPLDLERHEVEPKNDDEGRFKPSTEAI